ncbi:polysaccharide deacetylase family protein [Hwangdonia lutea]|uniref:Polysaccharide deacetylase family protein n=1 Tax=Hwangdonia lutea TaxID=3075823 RepID=A0AA97EJ85_9FLAO|nr:polysaccharide deacetylase family protein [Hwangdonia sp. SCSIO 19198]WOD42067.1 polysaccharide deacetylase family protein [Hwangdonia sp. SCSIO 19198]
MTLTPVKTPMLVKRMFPNYIWNIPTANKTIYLTFDDGPTPNITNWTLDVLKQHKAKATFFCIGNNIEKHPEIFQHVINDGHAIGNHTHNHVKGWKTKTDDYLKNVSEAEKVIKSHFKNRKSKIENLFRPPYGQIKPKQGKQLIGLGYKIIMWDVLSFDWDKNVTPIDCLNNVISKTTNGSIIVFHDSVKASKNMQYALPKVLEYFNEKGYNFEALT